MGAKSKPQYSFVADDLNLREVKVTALMILGPSSLNVSHFFYGFSRYFMASISLTFLHKIHITSLFLEPSFMVNESVTFSVDDIISKQGLF